MQSMEARCIKLMKWYVPATVQDQQRDAKEVSNLVLRRGQKLCNILEWREQKIVYRRYASLYFICSIDRDDNELIALETIHMYVEMLDRYFGNVCELDVIFNFHKAQYILDEVLMSGELQESSKRVVSYVLESNTFHNRKYRKLVLRAISAEDELEDEKSSSSSKRR
ncbi:clathrin coat assembly protein ap19, putative [Perkinsus marinus ATCC 50983]|uniref:Clathrin coat assembly protein ap19, putative n=1 Tax=Perkinsus marinus (strain ATCC 50983 / TXsc) TaxID=423536 RepID=C5KDS0_PERM5|nr:clathrin coat assembly protein ap19, putative [Perkinsus marinus ATCC 50983]EER17373.1 clathrin coat assembly protein ap19, putative [Perkinsus marinus ATCC 50983]|eukprot:XP_002785577.1 clathrin coat assembly protein ap19, putative [Perkinsus marinus ATCC 50983]